MPKQKRFDGIRWPLLSNHQSKVAKHEERNSLVSNFERTAVHVHIVRIYALAYIASFLVQSSHLG